MAKANNKIQGKEGKVIIGGKERTLKYPIMALIKLEKETGLRLQDLGDEEVASDMNTVLSFVWAGLLHENPDLTVEEVGFEFDVNEINDVVSGMTQALGGEQEIEKSKEKSKEVEGKN